LNVARPPVAVLDGGIPKTAVMCVASGPVLPTVPPDAAGMLTARVWCGSGCVR
jgi:hypothetical protein